MQNCFTALMIRKEGLLNIVLVKKGLHYSLVKSDLALRTIGSCCSNAVFLLVHLIKFHCFSLKSLGTNYQIKFS